MEENKINSGFDRGIDYESIKQKITSKIDSLYRAYRKKPKKTDFSRLVYAVISAIQLRNGSRISEAVKAFNQFIEKGISERVIVKISKSDGIRIMKDGTKKQKKARFREMMFPNKWFNDKVFPLIEKSEQTKQLIATNKLKKRVLDYLLHHMDCNTHSLRYAFINHMLYIVKRPAEDIAKFVGHIDTNMLTRYTQLKNCNQIFDLDL
jgi:integrase